MGAVMGAVTAPMGAVTARMGAVTARMGAVRSMGAVTASIPPPPLPPPPPRRHRRVRVERIRHPSISRAAGPLIRYSFPDIVRVISESA